MSFLDLIFSFYQMAVCPIPVLEGWNAPAHPMAHGNVVPALPVSKAMEHFARMSMR